MRKSSVTALTSCLQPAVIEAANASWRRTIKASWIEAGSQTGSQRSPDSGDAKPRQATGKARSQPCRATRGNTQPRNENRLLSSRSRVRVAVGALRFRPRSGQVSLVGQVGDRALAIVGGVQVDECGPGRRVAHAFHQLAKVRARIGRERVPSMEPTLANYLQFIVEADGAVEVPISEARAGSGK